MRERVAVKQNSIKAARLVIMLLSLLSFLAFASIDSNASGVSFTDTDAATDYLKGQMKSRNTSISLKLEVPNTLSANADAAAQNSYTNSIAKKIIYGVYDHTGAPEEGDYLKNSIKKVTCSIIAKRITTSSKFVIEMKFTFDYYTTLAQEKSFETEAKKVISGMNLNGKTEYEKVKTIYDYICRNVTYDRAHLNDDTYTLKQSAYAALINKTSVCQGYATLFYYMTNSVGVDSRVVLGNSYDSQGSVGENHAWNIVEIDGKYYYCDTTWDSGTGEYKYFLKGKNTLSHKNSVIEQMDKKVNPETVLSVSQDDYWNYMTQNGYTRINLSGAKASFTDGIYSVESLGSSSGLVTAEPVVTLNGVVLVKGIDYKVSYVSVLIHSNGLSGECTAKIEGRGAYQSSFEEKFKVEIKVASSNTGSSNNSGTKEGKNTSNTSDSKVSDPDKTSNVASNVKDSNTTQKIVTTENSIKVGTTLKTKEYTYKITKLKGKKGEVTLVKCNKNLKKANIPVAVKVNGITLKVTKIGNNAFKNKKKLTKVIITSNIKSIGKKAFYGCKKLKSITINSKKLSKVGSKAFSGVPSKAKVTVVKGKVKKYRRLLRNAGLSKKIKVK